MGWFSDGNRGQLRGNGGSVRWAGERSGERFKEVEQFLGVQRFCQEVAHTRLEAPASLPVQRVGGKGDDRHPGLLALLLPDAPDGRRGQASGEVHVTRSRAVAAETGSARSARLIRS